MHSDPDCADPKAKEFKKQEIDRMLALEVIGIVQTELASLIIFVPKKTAYPASVSIIGN